MTIRTTDVDRPDGGPDLRPTGEALPPNGALSPQEALAEILKPPEPEIPEQRPRRDLFSRQLAVLLTGTAVLYLWELDRTRWGNSYYAAAAQAGTQSWKALLFAAADPGNIVTVDKPPASLWVMGLSGRLFGFSHWSLLAPQALEGVAAVGLLAVTIRRWSGPAAGLAGGAVLALTPIAVMMFRFDNPDALLVLLMVAGAYGVVRATEAGSARWLMAAGVVTGLAFLTKMLQGFLMVPAFALIYLVAAPVRPLRRLLHLCAAGLAIVVSAGWYVALVELWPPSSRPYIGGSEGNSLLELTVGYNGLGRILGQHGPGQSGPGLSGPGLSGPGLSGPGLSGPGLSGPGQSGPGLGHPVTGGGHGFGGFRVAPGVLRLFHGAFGTQISWLLPAALIALVAGLWLTRRAPRTDRTRAALLLWGAWLIVAGLTFSFMRGIVHEYYTVALAPAVAGLLVTGVPLVVRNRLTWLLALMVLETGVWASRLLAETPAWLPPLRWIVPALALVAAVALLVPARRRLRIAGAATAVVAAGLAPVAYAIDTAATPHAGSMILAGPPRADRRGRPPFLDDPRARTRLVDLLKSTSTEWAAATVGAMQAAPMQLAADRPVMMIGGFGGRDPVPTLARFQKYVSDRQVRYFIVSPPRHFPGQGSSGQGFSGQGFSGQGFSGQGFSGRDSRNSTGAEITAWVQRSFTPTAIGVDKVYDLAAPSTP